MRILWAACPQQGSLFPMVPIVRELRSRGHAVTAIADGSGAHEFLDLGVEFIAARRRDDVGLRGIAAADVAMRHAWHEAYVRAWFADVTDALASSRFDVVLADPLEPGAGLAAEAAGVAHVSYAHWAMDHQGADVFFTTHLWDGTGDPVDAFITFWNRQREAVGLASDARPKDEHVWYRQSAQLSVVLGLPELVHPRPPLPPYAVRVGPSVWNPPRDAGVPVVPLPTDSTTQVVLASASTVGTSDTRLLAAMMEAVRDEPLQVLLTLPNGPPPDRLPRNVTALPFVPHDAELFERVDYVISHSGLGMVTKAACAGVPMLLLPRKGDQFASARGAVHAGIAVSVQPSEVSAESLRSALARLRTDPSYRERATELSRRARDYDAPRDAADAIEAIT